MWKKTFNIFGTPFTISLSKIKSWKNQIAHFGTHCLLSILCPMFSLGAAIAIEGRDGEQGHLESWKEGFNIFPDFIFRLGGVFVGFFINSIVY